MKKVLIFGIGGFVGSYLARELQDAGYQVYGSDIAAPKTPQPDVTFVTADLLDAETVQRTIEEIGPDLIINLAAISSVGASWNIPQTTMAVNVTGPLNIMEAARKIPQPPKILFIGSSEEYEMTDTDISEETPLNANNPYGISKMAQERFAEVYRERYGLQIYCVRAFNHTGVGQRDSFVLPSFCKQAAQIEASGQPGVIHVGNLAAERDFSDVRDIVRAYRMIIESPDCTKIYNVGSGKAYSLEKMLEYIAGLSSQPITIQVDPERFRPVDQKRICCDYSLIQAELGWRPEHDIFETLKEIFEAFLTQCRS